MRLLPFILFLALPINAAELASGVALENGVSPDKRREVVLEADKGSPRYEAYEFKGGDDQYPAFLIREVKTGSILARAGWRGDAGSDTQPLRRHSQVSWNPAGTAVILNTGERFYSHSNVWAFDEATGTFKEIELPNYKTMTGYETPNPDDLHPRGHNSAAWTKDGNLVYEIILSPLNRKEGGDPFRHKITLRLGAKGFEVISREPLKNEG